MFSLKKQTKIPDGRTNDQQNPINVVFLPYTENLSSLCHNQKFSLEF
jgi:hypothetical protein